MRVYKEVPMWWYAIIFFSCLGLAMFVCEYYAINLPWWAVLTAIMLAVITIVPIGIIQAITYLSGNLCTFPHLLSEILKLD